jgi:hypothetical protein
LGKFEFFWRILKIEFLLNQYGVVVSPVNRIRILNLTQCLQEVISGKLVDNIFEYIYEKIFFFIFYFLIFF